MNKTAATMTNGKMLSNNPSPFLVFTLVTKLYFL